MIQALIGSFLPNKKNQRLLLTLIFHCVRIINCIIVNDVLYLAFDLCIFTVVYSSLV